jgi:cysteine desulfurase family protein
MGAEIIYFNNSATTLKKPDAVYDAFVNASKTLSNMGRGASALAIQTSRAVFGARENVAGLLGAPNPLRVGFTKNATEALNAGICGLLRAGDHVVSTVCDHNSVLRPLFRLEKEQGVEVTLIPCDSLGEIDPQDFRKALKPNTKMIVMTHVSNVTGNIFDIAAVAAIAKECGALFFVDASQSAGVVDIDVQKDMIDLLAFTAHKYLFGPQGVGGLYVREGITLRPLMLGGGAGNSLDLHPNPDMPEALEAGTVNMPGIVALGRAVEFIRENREAIQRKEAELTGYFLTRLREIPGIKVLGRQEGDKRVALFPLVCREYSIEDIAAYLEERYGVVVRTGFQCAPMIHSCLGSGKTGVLRVSLSYFNEKSEIDVFMEGLKAFFHK